MGVDLATVARPNVRAAAIGRDRETPHDDPELDRDIRHDTGPHLRLLPLRRLPLCRRLPLLRLRQQLRVRRQDGQLTPDVRRRVRRPPHPPQATP